ncbi:LysR family transcriptional regulator [Paucilactobacillus kaifaensis]|uniref:LysR family transcriptional regulator n=1 Tax=Paucilactobacillus kaifaensis TaxID=2559921 RepID=UPI001484D520|nr:LysR family transcriptional regulator [Paucilactobacillus kaifaensis]
MDDKLKYFLYAAETLNFSKTAEHFFISATAVSKSINKLEDTVGVLLFNRHHNSIELTPAGKAFYENAKFVASDYKTAIESARQVDVHVQPKITIGFSSLYEARIIVPILNHYKQNNNGTIFEYTHRSIEQLHQGLADGNIDLAYSFGMMQDQENVTNTLLLASDYTIGISKYNNLATANSLNVQELDNLACGYYSQYNSVSAKNWLDQQAKRAGINNLHYIQFETLETLLSSVANNQCFAFFPDLFSNSHLFPDIVFLPNNNPFSSYQLVQSSLNNINNNVAKIANFVDKNFH